MFTLISIVLGILFYLFSSVASAATYGERLCKKDSRYACYTIEREQNWDNLFYTHTQRDLVMRLNRMNINLRPGMVIAVPRDPYTTLSDIAPFHHRINPPGEKVVVVSLHELAWGAYDPSGQLVAWGPVSGGRGYCPDTGSYCRTKPGKFTFYTKQGGGCVSTKFPVGRGGAPMPYCMFFHGGFAMHGSYEVPGYNASHGCVRMYSSDAKWLNQNFVELGKTKVIIYPP